MKRFLASICALGVLAVVSAGCNASSVPSTAARVGNESIPTSQLDAAMSELRADTGYLCASGLGTGFATTGAGRDTWSTVYADYVLTQLIKYRILDQMVAEHHLVAPPAQGSAATQEAENTVAEGMEIVQHDSPPVTCSGSPASIIASLGSSFRAALIDNEVNEDLYSAYLAGTSLQPAALAIWERSHASDTTESCTSILVVPTDKEAVSIRKAIVGGASFATEAKAHSENVGAGPGGYVGCILESQWAAGLGPVVGALSLGVVSQPVHFQNGYVLFDVSKRQFEPTSAIVPLIDQLELTAFNTSYAKALATAHVSVSSVYGSVERKAEKGGYTIAVVPPSAKSCAYALTPTAAGCPATSPTSSGSTTGSPAPSGSS